MNRDAAIARENVVHTYLELARALPEARVTKQAGFTSVVGEIDLALCNFVIDMRLGTTEALIEEGLHLLSELTLGRPSFRVFGLDGDEPSDLPDRLEACGFELQHELAQMIYRHPQSAGTPLIAIARAESEREEISGFMATQFFWRQDQNLRRAVVMATSRSVHELYGCRERGELVGAVMLTETPDSIGLYNLCVAKPRRGHGLGRKIVELCGEIANSRGKNLVLQADSHLDDWYVHLGFERVGTIQAFHPVKKKGLDLRTQL